MHVRVAKSLLLIGLLASCGVAQPSLSATDLHVTPSASPAPTFAAQTATAPPRRQPNLMVSPTRWPTAPSAVSAAPSTVGPTQPSTPAITSTIVLEPARSQLPAAGICGQPNEANLVVAIDFNSDTPAPRCRQVVAAQRLQVTNHTSDTLDVKLAGFSAHLAREQTYLFDAPFGTFLAPGVHTVWASSYPGSGGAELWLVPAPSTRLSLRPRLGAIELGMPGTAVLGLYGEPRLRTITHGQGGAEWHYANGLVVHLDGTPDNTPIRAIEARAPFREATPEGFRLGDTQTHFAQLYTGHPQLLFQNPLGPGLQVTITPGTYLSVQFDTYGKATALSVLFDG